MIAEALIPVFFVMFLGYFAGARRIIDNQQVASLTVLVMTFALPAALFVGVAQTSRSGLEENGKLVLVLVISMLVIFGITFALNHYIFRLSPGENAVQSLSVGFPNFAAVGLPLLGSVMGPGSAISAAVSLAARRDPALARSLAEEHRYRHHGRAGGPLLGHGRERMALGVRLAAAGNAMDHVLSQQLGAFADRAVHAVER